MADVEKDNDVAENAGPVLGMVAMNTKAVGPALTRWEWANLACYRGETLRLDGGDLVLGSEGYAYVEGQGEILVNDERRLEAQDRAAVAALALHGQPFGFDWNDVDLLREMAKSADWAAEYANDGSGSAEAAAVASPLESLADRIAALLPPRAP